ncbi:MAG: dienelactone hydrolase family protein [Proteobacteria bacterium]|nr:dienelactone hydrolase family protein [Pseudomonadota bacterium]MBU1686901.1 dienelactone hydrolase family protein [Pseudomonadota bacterium]
MGKVILLLILLVASPAFAVTGKTINYEVNGQTYEGYYITPAPTAPFILLIHDWDGLTDYEIKRAGMLADLGYAVFAADLFGAGVRPTEVTDKKQHTGELYKDRAKMLALMNGALKTAKSLGAHVDNGVTMGYCFGGAAVLELARSGAAMKGFVTFHGGLATPEGQDYAKTKGQLLILHGTADTNITMDLFAGLALELEENDIPHELITYGGAPHAFTVYDSPGYRAETDRKSWQRFTEFLDEVLKK